MGSALARTLHQAGHALTVWNRSPEKMQPLVTDGANGAASAADAVDASPVILICIDNYAVTRDLLSADDVVSHLNGRTIIQLSTGTPREARESAAWMNDRGVAYIDGAILGGPVNIGTPGGQILFAGPEAVFRNVQPLVDCLGGKVRHVGENIRSAAALDLAWLCQRFGLFLGVIQGAYLCESEDVSVDLYASMFPEGDRARATAQTIHSGEFANPGATLAVWEGALQRIQQQAGDARLNSEIPDFASSFFQRAIAAGHGEEDVAALVKVLRGS
jgi:3-hydroxyisobutyrate dehydrogenase-like beta-hydroxyacid dehydrogenase